MRARTAFAVIKAMCINLPIMPKPRSGRAGEQRGLRKKVGHGVYSSRMTLDGVLSKISDEAAKAEAGSAMDPLWDRPRAPRLPLRTSSTVQGGEKQCGTYAYLRLDGLRFSARRLGLELRSSSMRP